MYKDWIVIGTLALSAAFTVNVSYSKPAVGSMVNMNAFSQELGGWRGHDMEIDERTYELLETRNVLMREYRKEGELPIVLCLVFSDQNRRALHPPEVCYQGDGYEILDKRIIKTSLTDSEGDPISGNQLALEKQGRRQSALYWYKVGPQHTPNFYRQQWSAFLGQLSGSRTPSALVRISTPLFPDETQSVKRMVEFGRELLPELASKTYQPYEP